MRFYIEACAGSKVRRPAGYLKTLALSFWLHSTTILIKDYYKLLGISRSSNAVAARKAYRRQALKLHPDVNKSPDAHSRFIELTAAYEVLKNPKRKHQYDRLYDYQILKKEPKRHRTYTRRESKWNQNINRSSEKGKRKGQKYSHTSYNSFERRTSFWSIFEPVFSILELIVYVLEFIFYL
jgi:DnaJ-class molecular chaperone